MFLSYAHGDEDYRHWVLNLAYTLRKDGVDLILDYWHRKDGQDWNQFMNHEVGQADRILVLGSEQYRLKCRKLDADGAMSGVGWEAQLITNKINQEGLGKVVVALGSGERKTALPDILTGRHAYRLYGDGAEKEYSALLQDLYQQRPKAPEPGEPPRFRRDNYARIFGLLGKDLHSDSLSEVRNPQPGAPRVEQGQELRSHPGRSPRAPGNISIGEPRAERESFSPGYTEGGKPRLLSWGLLVVLMIGAVSALRLRGHGEEHNSSGMPREAVPIEPSHVLGLLEIHHINVQQGDCTLIIGPNDSAILIDGGKPGKGVAKVVPYLAGIGLTPERGIEYMVCTHRDSDHLGGLDEVIGAGYDISTTVWDNGSSKTDSFGTEIQDFLDAAATTSAGAVQPIPLGQVIELGYGATATCVAVGGAVHGVGQVVSDPGENDQSVALLVRYRDFEYITAGDLGGGEFQDDECTFRTTGQANIETSLAQVLAPGGPIGILTADGVEVLDVNHHGSESSTNHDYMNLLSPSVAVINTGAGQGGNFHHPREDVVERVLRAGADCITAAPALVLQTEEGFPIGLQTSFDGYCVGDVVIRTRGTGSFEVTATGQVGQGPDERAAAGLLPGPLVLPMDGAAVDTQRIVITEIMQNPNDVPDNAGEWFEVFNPGSVAVNLQGWTIRDEHVDQHVIAAPGGSLIIAAGGRLVLGRDGSPAQNGGLVVDYVYSGIDLANGEDELELRDASGTLVDRVAYTGGFPWPAPSGASMRLLDPAEDNAVGANWDTAAARAGSYAAGGTDRGSPGD